MSSKRRGDPFGGMIPGRMANHPYLVGLLVSCSALSLSVTAAAQIPVPTGDPRTDVPAPPSTAAPAASTQDAATPDPQNEALSHFEKGKELYKADSIPEAL